MNKKILIFGGSGFIDSCLTKALLDNNYKILVVCRNTEKASNRVGNHKNLQTKSIDIFNDDEVRELVKKCNVIVNLIGKLFEVQKGDFRKFHYTFPDVLSRNLPDNTQLIHILSSWYRKVNTNISLCCNKIRWTGCSY